MKYLVTFFLSVLLCLNINGQLSSNLSAYYKFDETSGTSVYNAVNSGVIIGSVVNADVNTTGKLGQAIDFDGSGDAVTLKDTITLQGDNSKMSFSCWIYLRAYPAVRSYIIGGETQSLGLTITPSGTLKAWSIGAYDAVESSLTVPLNQWTFVGMSWVSTAVGVKDSINYQINGTYEQVLSVSTSFSVNPGASSMYIGALNGDGSTYCINAILDEIGIWKGIRFKEVHFDSLYNNGTGLTYPFEIESEEESDTSTIVNGLISYWMFNETSGSTVYDATINNVDGTVTGALINQTGVVNKAVSFDGNGDKIDFGSSNTLDVGLNDYTFSCWFKTNVTLANSTDLYGLFIQGYTSGDYGLYITLRGGSYNGILVRIFNGTTYYDYYPSSDIRSIINNNQWNHFAVTIDRDANLVIYFNKIAVRTSSISSYSTLNITSTRNHTIGLISLSYGFNGLIDEVGIWNRSLSSSGIDSVYQYGISKISYPFIVPTPVVVVHGTTNYINGSLYLNKIDNLTANKWIINFPDTSDFVVNPPSLLGIYSVMGEEDYDGNCPSGETRITDSDCIINDMDLAPLRKFRDSNDYSIVYHIDPTANDPSENGSVEHPYNSYSDFSPVNNMAVLFKRGTTYDHGNTINISQSNVLISDYGSSPELANVVRETANQRVFYLTGASLKTISNIRISNPWVLRNARPAQQSSTACIDVSDNVECDVYNVRMDSAWFGYRSAGFNSKIRIVNCEAFHILTEAAWVRAPYMEIRYNKFYDNNWYWYDEPDTDTDAGENTGSTGDGLELSGNWSQAYIANNLIDRSKTGNKATIQYHNSASAHELDITEFNILVSPYNGIYDDERLFVRLGYNSRFFNNLCIASPHSPTKSKGGFCSIGNDTVAGNVFIGFSYAYEGGLNHIFANNTFINNDLCVYNSGPITIPVWHNNITYNNTNIFAAGTTITSSQNNLTTNPLFDLADTNGFHILSSSPAIGAANGIKYTQYDIDGDIRLNDIGADSYVNEDQTYIVYKEWDFEEEELGTYTNAEILEDFNADFIYSHNGNASIVNDEINGVATKVMRIRHRAESLGDGFEMNVDLEQDYPELWLSYNWKFDPEFNTTSGGKLPGLGGEPTDWSGDLSCPEGPNEGFRAHNLFKHSGFMSSYHYDRTTGTCPWATIEDSVSMNFGNWYNIMQRLVMNTFINGVANSDGIKEVWIDGKLILKETNLKLMEVESATMQIDAFRLSHFYGGATSDYAPATETYGYIDNIKVYIPTNDPVYGTRNTHDNDVIIETPDEITDRVFDYDILVTSEGMLSNTSYANCINETWLIDAGAGNTVTFTAAASGTYIGGGDYLYFFDGNTTDSNILYVKNTSGDINNLVVSSTGRYMYVRFATNKDGPAAGWTGTITFE